MSKTFKVKYDQIVNRLPVCVTITDPRTKLSKYVNAIFDTGAMVSGISEEVASGLKLEATGSVIMNSANARSINSICIVNITLPGDIAFNKISVSVSNLPKSIDAIIGMDILSCFDILITNSLSTSLSGLTPPAIPPSIAVNHFL